MKENTQNVIIGLFVFAMIFLVMFLFCWNILVALGLTIIIVGVVTGIWGNRKKKEKEEDTIIV